MIEQFRNNNIYEPSQGELFSACNEAGSMAAGLVFHDMRPGITVTYRGFPIQIRTFSQANSGVFMVQIFAVSPFDTDYDLLYSFNPGFAGKLTYGQIGLFDAQAGQHIISSLDSRMFTDHVKSAFIKMLQLIDKELEISS